MPKLLVPHSLRCVTDILIIVVLCVWAGNHILLNHLILEPVVDESPPYARVVTYFGLHCRNGRFRHRIALVLFAGLGLTVLLSDLVERGVILRGAIFRVL